MEQKKGKFPTDEQMKPEKISYISSDNWNEDQGSVNPRLTHDPSNSVNMTVGPRPVLNYSIQTGEEFALEFMWERVNPRQPYILSPTVEGNKETTSVDRSNGRPGPVNNVLPPVIKPLQTVSRTSSKATSAHRLRTHSSLGSFGGSSKAMKMLCSFDGKILPRPSDRKLRYVGGETRILRIRKDITWDELKQRTLAIYPEPHSIKYQLPGEDLDALVSVSCDEDVQNMMEECTVIDNGGSQKLRAFLLSDNELDDSQAGLESVDGYSDIQYVVAVNGMDFGSRRNSIGVGSQLGNNLDELLGLGVGKETGQVSLAPSHAFESTSFGHQGRTINHEQTEWNSSRVIQRTDTEDEKFVVPTSNRAPVAEKVVPNPVLEHTVPREAPNKTAGQKKIGPDKNHSPGPDDVLQTDTQLNKESSVQKINESSKTQTFGEGKTTASHPNNVLSEEATAVSASVEKGTLVIPTNADNEAHTKDISYEADAIPQPIFHSERIHREQAELNRWSKSDDSFGPQFLMTHSRSDVSQQITDSVRKLTDTSVTEEIIAQKTAHDTDDINKNEPNPKAEMKAVVDDESTLTTLEIHQRKMSRNDESSRIGGGAGTKERGDILIDINDRFPHELLSDIFRAAESSVGVVSHTAGLSVDMVNHEPKRWSFFQNLAQGDSRKDVSLMDQDHPTFSSSVVKFGDNAGPMDYGYMPFEAGVVAADQGLPPGPLRPDTMNLPSDYDISQMNVVESSQSNRQISSRPAGSDNQDGKIAIQPAGIPLDFSVEDRSSLQIINNRDLEELRELGSGTYGTVYHGKWRGSDVAIKRLKKSCFPGRSSEQERLTDDFWHEASILSKLHHPNVVAFYGVVQDGPGGTLATVTEYMVNGSLRHALISKDRHLDRRKRLIIAMDAAFGMEYLHARNIVHFDLKCDNLLVNLKDPSRPICKVGDFGLSKIKRNTLVTGGVRGTLPWMAPELLNGGSSMVSEKVDVFSFGIVLWEILTGEEPYANMHYGAIIGGIVNNTLRPLVPSFCDPEWRLLMEQCWAPDPLARPSFTEIAGRLRTMSAAASLAKQQVIAARNQLPK
ncbi:hypothetical protein CASFOL_039117 [Castilleja foliolosa]|uniref:Protein kinase domain-containing protein n=1 Tax=Castilleja foliolosa TaxID=1961234 RepID=A0ABD3BH38_9LAMI